VVHPPITRIENEATICITANVFDLDLDNFSFYQPFIHLIHVRDC